MVRTDDGLPILEPNFRADYTHVCGGRFNCCLCPYTGDKARTLTTFVSSGGSRVSSVTFVLHAESS